MSDEPSLPDANPPTTDEILARVRRDYPKPDTTPPPQRPKLPPLKTARTILALFALAASLALVIDAVAIFARPDQHVFVAMSSEKTGDKFHV